MEDWQERVVAERDELVEKIEKLSDFLEPTPTHIPFAEVRRLADQWDAMENYRARLDERIRSWS